MTDLEHPKEEESDIFTPRPGLRNSNLWKDDKPDPRLTTLIKLLARSAASQFLEESEKNEKPEE